MNKKTLSVIVFLLSLFTACNMAGPELKESSGQEQSPEQGQEQSPVEDGKVAVRLHIEAEGAPARTVRPTVALSDAAKWRLSGAKDGGDSAELKEFTGDSDTIYLEAGSWDFVLDGFSDNECNTLILSGSLENQTIAAADDSNSLSFIVAPVLDGTGTVKLTVTMPAGFISRVDVAQEGETPESKTPSPVSGDSTRESIVFEASLGTGEYYFIIKLWKDNELYGVVSELVYVRGGLTSKKTYELQQADLNLTYIINYHEWDGLGTAKVEEAYYRKTDADKTLSSPPAVSGYVFKGWYETTAPLDLDQDDPAFNEPDLSQVITTLDTDAMEHKHYYPYWKLVTVPSSLNLAQSLAWISSHVEPNQTYTITVKLDEPIDPQTLSYNGQTVGITLISDSTERIVSLSSNGSLFMVENGVTLTLGSNITLRGKSGNSDSLVEVKSGGVLVMESGSKITGNSGGGVFVHDSGATFEMNGGEISGNTGSSSGGVTVANSGTFEMNGGKISGNTVSGYNGGGVIVSGSDATFEMSGGEISGNTVSGYNGGGVYVTSSGTFEMSGGEISDNSASSGGGVYVQGGTFTMSDGEISGNTVSGDGDGGGVYVASSGTFEMSGGEISGNTASGGGGVFVDSGTFTKSGGTIYGPDNASLKNTATSGDAYGHAVYVNSGSKRRNTTAGTGVDLNSGTDANWEYAAGVAIALKVDPSDPTFTGNTAMTTAEPGSFSVDGAYTSYQWYWNGEPDSGATSNTYTWAAGEKLAGIHELSVRVVGADGELSAHCRVTISN